MSVYDLFRLDTLEKPETVSPDSVPRLVRLESDAGAFVVVENGANVGYVAAFQMSAGGLPRGAHYHKEKVESLIVLEGKLRAVLVDIHDPTSQIELPLDPSRRLTISPLCAHIIYAETDSWVVETAPKPVRFADSVPYNFPARL